jgi:c-di-GMP-binding flagellar brake protein YcgR
MLVYKIVQPFEVVSKIGSEDISAVMTDLSEGGLAFISAYQLPVSTIVNAKFTVMTRDIGGRSKGTKLEIKCEVVNTLSLSKGEYRSGARFINITDEKRRMINDFAQDISTD